MSELIAFEVYRTEVFAFNGERFTVRFTKRKDGEEYALFATNDAATKNWSAFYSAEVAENFKSSRGQSLEEEVYRVLQGDIERGHVHPHTPAAT